ncbi:MAG: M23 family metallopeptidase [Clostridiales bacterium]|nr:M23 family metallopeptidase [Clostridiales bacterium]
MNKKTVWQRIGAFFSGKGFYMVLVLCIGAIGASGWYLWKTMRLATDSMAEAASGAATVTVAQEEEDAPPEAEELAPEDSAAQEEAQPSSAGAEEEQAIATPVSDSAAAQEEAEEDADATATETAAAEETVAEDSSSKNEVVETAVETVDNLHQTMQYPVPGSVVAAFSSDTLTYNEALEDWRTHNGVDLSAEVGDDVVAAWSGQVVSVREDAVLGVTVTIDCGDGYTTVYGNLAEPAAVSAGNQVSAGDVLGAVGETAGGETHGGDGFLHFAVLLDGDYVDPMEFLS